MTGISVSSKKARWTERQVKHRWAYQFSLEERQTGVLSAYRRETAIAAFAFRLELELGLIKTYVTQNPVLRVEVCELAVRQVKNVRGDWAGAVVQGAFVGVRWVFQPRLGCLVSLAFFFFARKPNRPP